MALIVEYFQKFCEDFGVFDGVLIASRFVSPLVVIDQNGTISSYDSSKAISEYFQVYLDEYKSKGVVSCVFSDLETVQINACSFLATVSWELLSSSGVVVANWRESYSLVRTQGELKAFATYDH
ncbi:MAG: hypothetical protein V7459_02495 [Oceanicoccus sp.]